MNPQAANFEAFSSRGKRDVLMSHDFEDIVNMLEDRPTVPDEIAGTGAELRNFLVEQFRALPGLVAMDELYHSRNEVTD